MGKGDLMEKEEKEEMVDDGPTKGSMHFLPIDILKRSLWGK